MLVPRADSAYQLPMLRDARLKHEPESIDGFRLRGREVTRLEGFSDAVFGFALTLLVVSLDVPKNFSDLANTMRGFPAFALCFLMLAIIWNSHYKFCRRYGLDDGTARFLTCVLLFLVLFYVYPLKFLFSLGINSIFFPAPATSVHITRGEFSTLLVIYGLGFAAVYLALSLLYLHAYALRDALDLSGLERLDTRYYIHRMLILVAVGLAAAGLARLGWLGEWGGLVYLILFPAGRIHGWLHRRKRAPLLVAANIR
jgi:hypothetical protein